MVQKSIEYQDWRYAMVEKKDSVWNDHPEIDDPKRLPLWSRMETPANKQEIVHEF